MEQYFDQLIAGKTTLRPLPSALASLLRERLPFRIDEAGVMSRAMDIAKEAKAEADSAEGAGGPVRRAPGGPPIPGAGALPRMPGQRRTDPSPRARRCRTRADGCGQRGAQAVDRGPGRRGRR